MLSTRPAEAIKRIVGNVIAALDGNLLNGISHVVDGDFEKTVGNFDRRAPVTRSGFDFSGQRLEFFAHHGIVQRLVRVGA